MDLSQLPGGPELERAMQAAAKQAYDQGYLLGALSATLKRCERMEQLLLKYDDTASVRLELEYGAPQ